MTQHGPSFVQSDVCLFSHFQSISYLSPPSKESFILVSSQSSLLAVMVILVHPDINFPSKVDVSVNFVDA